MKDAKVMLVELGVVIILALADATAAAEVDVKIIHVHTDVGKVAVVVVGHQLLALVAATVNVLMDVTKMGVLVVVGNLV